MQRTCMIGFNMTYGPRYLPSPISFRPRPRTYIFAYIVLYSRGDILCGETTRSICQLPQILLVTTYPTNGKYNASAIMTIALGLLYSLRNFRRHCRKQPRTINIPENYVVYFPRDQKSKSFRTEFRRACFEVNLDTHFCLLDKVLGNLVTSLVICTKLF